MLSSFAQVPDYHLITVEATEENTELLKQTGIASSFYINNNQYVAELSGDDLMILDQANIPYQVSIRDVSTFYEQRNRGKDVDIILNNFRNMDSYDVPENFSLGSMGGFCKWDEINAHLDSMHVLFPDMVSAKEALPTVSWQGNPIYWLKISDNPNIDEDEPEILYNSLIHAREPASAQQLLYFMYHMLENYEIDPEIKRIIENTEMYFILCINPDGYLYNEENFPNGGGMWRKNRAVNINSSHGVDLNRNFGYMWGYDDIGSSDVPNSSTYRGEGPMSEPEVQAIADFAASRDFKLVINYHSYGQLLLHPWGYVSYITPDDYDQIMDMASVMTQDNFFNYGTPSRWLYLVNGDATDWFYGEEAVFAFTPEVGSSENGFWPPIEDIIPQCQSCLEMNITAAQMAGCHTTLYDAGPLNITEAEGYLNIELQRTGLTNMPFNISISPISQVFDSLGPSHEIAYVPVDERISDSVFYRLSPGMKPGDEISYLVKVENEAFVITDTITKVFGQEMVLLNENFDDFINWETDLWAYRTDHFTSPQFAASNVEGSYYGSNEASYIYYMDTILVSDCDAAWVNFKARWDLDGGHDFVKFVVSTDYGITWNNFPGRFTLSILSDLGVIHAYEGKSDEWLDEWILIEDIRHVPLRFGFQFTSDKLYGRSGFYCDDFRFVTANMETSQHSISIQEGWTGISSFLIPAHAGIETILQEHMEDVEFLTDDIQFFQPGNLNSSLTDWNSADGYMIKSSQPFVLNFNGYPEKSTRLYLVSGWNLISIISDQPLPVHSIVTQPSNMIQVIKEACGSLTNWPEQEVQSLEVLQPGKSYFIKMNSDAVLILE